MLAIQDEGAGLPAVPMGGAFGEAEGLRAVLGFGTALLGLARAFRCGHAPQGRILAQAADHHDPGGQRPPQERPLGVGAVGDDPQRFAQKPQPIGQPLDQVGGHVQLGPEGHPIQAVQQGDLLLADVQQGAQGQAKGTPAGMAHDPGQGNPDVPVEELLVGRSGGGVVMDAGPLDVRPVALGGRVVQRQQQPLARIDQRHRPAEQQRGDILDVASEAAEEVIIASVIVAESAAAQPTGDRSPALGEEHAREQRQQAPRQAGVQRLAQVVDPQDQFGGQVPLGHPWLSLSRWGL